ncbi:NUDIX domain-containing protein [Prauserella cavernicola]|uniref:8-oxo-dGTP diphosphatase n=1 Tax=Prauserella cavernicola TaxID=2800127 RepID=A0A934V2U6_9PSEU|nr:NUDIX domain-containing protein [Prauserella cavernicola]MBK1786461.1 NUDIX domain-containing protein [Prauserella cavernicola]
MKRKPHRCVAALLVHEGRVLLAHRSSRRAWHPDVWDLPGGHVEDGEHPATALIRELREELGITVGQRTLSSAPRIELHTDDVVVEIRVVREWTGTVVNAAPDEHDSIAWFAPADTESLTLADPSYRGLIEAVRTGPRRHLCALVGGTVAEEVDVARHRWDPVMAAVAPPHVTLSYPEEVTDERLLLDRMAAVAEHQPPFHLTLAQSFTREGGTFLGLLDVEGGWARLRETLLAAPFRAVDFPPHLTVAHPRTSHHGEACAQELRAPVGASVRVDEICFTETGLAFTVLHRFPLRGRATDASPDPPRGS